MLMVYLAGLFQPSGWAVRHAGGLREAAAFLARRQVAVAICEETLPEGSWRDASVILGIAPSAPMLVVVGDDHELVREVAAAGAFDVLTRPLSEPEVIWTVASAWRHWIERNHSHDPGGPRCSDA